MLRALILSHGDMIPWRNSKENKLLKSSFFFFTEAKYYYIQQKGQTNASFV